ncbi:MAG: Cytochrome c oxidase subunit 6 [Phylliscum demangeonii]|nr:MAG: Cytochrome c oxidase subunit 6 [Phylliscum demangeonii]
MSSLQLLRCATRSIASPLTPSSCRAAAAGRRLPSGPARGSNAMAGTVMPASMMTATTTTSVNGSGSHAFSTSALRMSNAHAEETFDEFNTRQAFEREFDTVNDVFELQRNLNNVFAYDLVPSVSVVMAALRAARRVHDFPTAVRIFEGIKSKVENKIQYQEYLDELKDFREELGVPLREEMYPDLRSR